MPNWKFAAVLAIFPALALPAPEEKAEPTPQPKVKTYTIESPRGQELLQGEDAEEFQALRKNWVAQLDSHCGAASAVVVGNTMQPDANYTQNNLFTEETVDIITQDVVFRIGFTLEELATMIERRQNLDAEYFHAGNGDNETSYQTFVEHLRANNNNPNNHIIINYLTAHTRGDGGGHHSPVAHYNEEENMVLVLEINEKWPIFWVDARDIYNAMATTDSVSDLHRGWVVVTPDNE